MPIRTRQRMSTDTNSICKNDVLITTHAVHQNTPKMRPPPYKLKDVDFYVEKIKMLNESLYLLDTYTKEELVELIGILNRVI